VLAEVSVCQLPQTDTVAAHAAVSPPQDPAAGLAHVFIDIHPLACSGIEPEVLPVYEYHPAGTAAALAHS
jgi:hypothetical protein